MKTIDIKSLFLGVLASLLIVTLTSSKSEEGDNIEFATASAGVGIYNKNTRTLYVYKLTFGGAGLQEKPVNTYKVSEDGSHLKSVD